ncbi:hypothetical protein MRX96_037914 [Rhipicephalus microplus]
MGLLPPGKRPGAGPVEELEELVPLSDEAARKIRLPAAKEHRPGKGCGQACGNSSGAGPSTSERRGCSLRGCRKAFGKMQNLRSGGGQRYYR